MNTLKNENDMLRNPDKNLSDEFPKFKDLMAAKTNKEVVVVTIPVMNPTQKTFSS